MFHELFRLRKCATLFLLYDAFASHIVAQSTKECYLPDGSLDGNGTTPCDASAKSSHCCGVRDLCLSNGFCFNTGDSTLYRSSCTDQSFTDSSCPYYCSDVSTGTDVTLLPTNEPPSFFCCSIVYNRTSKLCQVSTHSSFAPFLLGRSTVIYNRTSGSTGPNSTAVQASQPTITVTLSSQCSHPSSQSGHDLSVGLGVGLPLGLLLLLTSSLLWRQKQQQKRPNTIFAESGKGFRTSEAIAMHSDTKGSRPELGGGTMLEADGHDQRAELGSH